MRLWRARDRQGGVQRCDAGNPVGRRSPAVEQRDEHVALVVIAGALHLPCPVDDAVRFGSTAEAWLYDITAERAVNRRPKRNGSPPPPPPPSCTKSCVCSSAVPSGCEAAASGADQSGRPVVASRATVQGGNAVPPVSTVMPGPSPETTTPLSASPSSRPPPTLWTPGPKCTLFAGWDGSPRPRTGVCPPWPRPAAVPARVVALGGYVAGAGHCHLDGVHPTPDCAQHDNRPRERRGPHAASEARAIPLRQLR